MAGKPASRIWASQSGPGARNPVLTLRQLGANGGEDRVEHFRRQAPGVGVVAGAVIAVVEGPAIAQIMAGAMAKGMGRPAQLQGRQQAVVGNLVAVLAPAARSGIAGRS